MNSVVMDVARSDIRANALSWLAFALTYVAAGTGVACALAFLVTGGGESEELGGTVLGMALVSVFASTATLSGLIVDERRRVYASWKMAGMSGAAASAVILFQVVAVAGLSSLGGSLVAPPIVGAMVARVRLEGVDVGDPRVNLAFIAIAVGICASGAVGGSLGRAVSVGWRPAVKAARGAAVPKVRRGVWATVFGLTFAGTGLILPFTGEMRGDPTAGVGIATIVLLAMVCLMPWFIRPVLQWTRALHACGVTARVATGSARARTAYTSAQVVPWFLLAGMVVGVGSPIKALSGVEEGAGVSSLGLTFVLLAPALVPALVAGVGSLCVMAPRTRADERTLARAGASTGQRNRALLWEASAVTATVGILTLGLALVGVALTNVTATGSAFPSAWWASILWLPLVAILSAMFALMAGVKMMLPRGRA